MAFVVFVGVNLLVVTAIWLRAVRLRRDDDQAEPQPPARVTRVRRRYAIRPVLL